MPQTKLDTLSPGQRGQVVMNSQVIMSHLKLTAKALAKLQDYLGVEVTIDDFKTLVTEFDEALDAFNVSDQTILDHLELLYEKRN